MGIFDKAKDALNSDKGEQYSDQALDKGETFASDKLGDKHSDKVSGTRDKIDERLGNEGNPGPDTADRDVTHDDDRIDGQVGEEGNPGPQPDRV